MAKCAICGRHADEENAPILTMGHYGSPRYLCAECADGLDRSTTEHDADAAESAIKAIGAKMAAGNPDEATMETVSEILGRAAERVKKIRDGDYDFADDEAEPQDELEDIPEELCETEEDRQKDEEEAETNRKFEKVTGVIAGILFAACAVVAILRFVFHLF